MTCIIMMTSLFPRLQKTTTSPVRALEDIEEKTGLIQRYHRTRAALSSLRDLCQQIQELNEERFSDNDLDDLMQQMTTVINDMERE